MTVPRAPGSIEEAVLAVLHNLAPAEVEAWTGRSPSYWYAVSNPSKAERLGFADAAKLDAAAIAKGQPARFRRLLDDLTKAALAKQGGEVARLALRDGLAHLVVDTGELAAAMTRAQADGTMTPAEGREIAREAQDVIDRATGIRDAALDGGA